MMDFATAFNGSHSFIVGFNSFNELCFGAIERQFSMFEFGAEFRYLAVRGHCSGSIEGIRNHGSIVGRVHLDRGAWVIDFVIPTSVLKFREDDESWEKRSKYGVSCHDFTRFDFQNSSRTILLHLASTYHLQQCLPNQNARRKQRNISQTSNRPRIPC